MAHYQSFEDLPIWQRARALSREVYTLSEHGSFAKDTGLRDQIRRAAVSTMSNIAEGFDRASNKDFTRFLSIAKASNSEARSQAYLALDLKYIDEGDHSTLNESLKLLGQEIGGFMRYLERNPKP